MMEYRESDEAYARRLQAQELGQAHALRPVDAQTPLVNRTNENPTVINARLREVSASRITLYVILAFHTPQILAILIVLMMHWNEKTVCDEIHNIRWKWWAIGSAVRMMSYTVVAFFADRFRTWLMDRPVYNERVKNIQHTLDAFHLIWFIVGNMWLFGDDESVCPHASKSPIYNLDVALLIINYIQICLPCIIAIMIIPLFCCCQPCLIRLLAQMQQQAGNAGASEVAIETLPEIVLDSSHIRPGQDNTCPICLSEMCVGEAARELRCSHVFHKTCVDEWLRVNASCPSCRKRIFENENTTIAPAASTSMTGGGGGGPSANAASAAIARSVGGDRELVTIMTPASSSGGSALGGAAQAMSISSSSGGSGRESSGNRGAYVLLSNNNSAHGGSGSGNTGGPTGSGGVGTSNSSYSRNV